MPKHLWGDVEARFGLKAVEMWGMTEVGCPIWTEMDGPYVPGSCGRVLSQWCDLRILDPNLSYPSSILGRERAIVVNLERFRAVITAHEVLIPNSKDPVVAPFVRELQARVSDSSAANQAVIASFQLQFFVVFLFF